MGWHRVGQNIEYVANDFRKDGNGRSLYTLSFEHTFATDNDSVYFAHCFPYTCSDLREDLARIESQPNSKHIFRREILCQTLMGNKAEVLTITSGLNKSPFTMK